MMRCMTAICPAGPPKLRSATRTQVGMASLSDGYEIGPALPTNVDLATTSFTSGPRLIGGPVVRLVGGIAAPAIEGVVKQHPSFELLQIVRYMLERPKDAASRPGAWGDNSGRAVSAPRTIVARRRRGGVPNPNSSTMVSNVQVSPRWLQKTPRCQMERLRSARLLPLHPTGAQTETRRVDRQSDE